MEGYCSTGQSPQRALVPMEEEEATLPEKQYVSLRNNEWIFLKHLGNLLKFDAFQLLVISDKCN